MIYLSQYSGQLGKCYIQLKKHIGLRDLRRASATCARDGGENPIAALTNGRDSSPNRRDSSPNRRNTFPNRRDTQNALGQKSKIQERNLKSYLQIAWSMVRVERICRVVICAGIETHSR